MTYAETAAPRYAIGKVRISAVTMDETLRLLDERSQMGKSAYVCVANVRAAIFAQENDKFCHIQNQSFLTIADGMPLVWYAKLEKICNIEKVSGPDVMTHILERSKHSNYSHYFYGDTESTLKLLREKLVERYGDLDIKAMVSPPFRPLTEEERIETANEINSLKPTFVWVGLGAPKQEFWMADMIARIDSSILLGVGAAFSFAVGRVHRPPQWVSNIGLEWLCRYFQQPIRSRRFIKPFFKFLLMLTLQLVHCVRYKARCKKIGADKVKIPTKEEVIK